MARDNQKCVVCGKPATCVHHIIERRLFEDGGYHPDNGACVCDPCHILAEKTLVPCETLREKAGIKAVYLPEHLDADTRYDKWGNPYLSANLRGQGELFHDESVQKILTEVIQDFAPRTKYPRTLHFDFSPGKSRDDLTVASYEGFEGKEVILAVKMDGENSTLSRDYLHARSLDSGNHPSRNWLRALHGKIQHEIPEGLSICGENLYAQHSLRYENLPSYFLVFNMWERGRRLAWDTTIAYAEMLGLHTVPVLYRGPWNLVKIKEICLGLDPRKYEGVVAQVTEEIKASQWRKTSAKYVRAGHVQTEKSWMAGPVIPNGLAQDPSETSFIASH